MDPIAQTVLNLWQGKLPLWVAFWVYAHVVYGVLFAAFHIAGEATKSQLEKLTATAGEGPFVQFVTYGGQFLMLLDKIALTLITVVALVGIWRCAPNTDWFGWTILSRAYVIFFILFIISCVIVGLKNRGVL